MKSYGVLLREISRRILSLLFCAVLLGGCSALIPVDTKAEGKSTAVPQKVIALSKSNAELWLLAGGSLIGTSEDAMEFVGISPETVSLGDMDHVSLEAIVGLEPDLIILFSTDPAQKALGEAAEEIGLPVFYTNIDSFEDYREVMLSFTSYFPKLMQPCCCS